VMMSVVYAAAHAISPVSGPELVALVCGGAAVYATLILLAGRVAGGCAPLDLLRDIVKGLRS